MAAAVPVIVGGVSLSLSSLAGVWILAGGGGVIVGGVWFRCQQRERGGGCLLSRWGRGLLPGSCDRWRCDRWRCDRWRCLISMSAEREGRRVSSFEMGARASAWFLSSLAVPDIAATMAGRWRALDSQTGSRGHRAAPPPASFHGPTGPARSRERCSLWRRKAVKHRGIKI